MSLLDRIKLRNQCIHQEKPKVDETSQEQQTSPNSKDSVTELESLNPIERSKKMSSMIKEYFTTSTLVMNRATTEEVVRYFKKKTLKKDGAKFKAILKKMCEFNDNSKAWSLKDEYFNL